MVKFGGASHVGGGSSLVRWVGGLCGMRHERRLVWRSGLNRISYHGGVCGGGGDGEVLGRWEEGREGKGKLGCARWTFR